MSTRDLNELLADRPALASALAAASDETEFLAAAREAGLDLDLPADVARSFEELSEDELEDVAGGAWTDGCGGSFCAFTRWTNTHDGCGGVVADPRIPYGDGRPTLNDTLGGASGPFQIPRV